MKKVIKVLGCLVAVAVAVEGILLLADYLYENYGKRYIVSAVEKD